MVYYVRFLKPPRAQQQKGSVSITTLICVTTDLGDSFLAEDVDLLGTARETTSSTCFQTKVQWNAYHRELPITLGPLPANMARKTFVLTVNSCTDSQDVSTTFPLQLVMGASSAPFGLDSMAEKLVRRHIRAPGLELNIWEETGNSIARHIWDAGFATVVYFHRMLGHPSGRASLEGNDRGNDTGPRFSALRKVLSTDRPTSIQVVELGAGCGIVGIGLAQMRQCSVLLTDLPEVEDIMTRNIHSNLCSNGSTGSSIEYQNLDWEQPPDHLCSRPIELILVSDCTYNADSLPVLVNCLERLVRMSPGAIILVSLKRRHDSETVFFDLMRSAGFTSEQDSMELPSQHGDVDEIEFHCYSHEPCL